MELNTQHSVELGVLVGFTFGFLACEQVRFSKHGARWNGIVVVGLLVGELIDVARNSWVRKMVKGYCGILSYIL